MAKKSKIVANDRRKDIVARYRDYRAELKEKIRSPNTSEDQRATARVALSSLPRDANPIRVRNRCFKTGRSRAILKKFMLSRIAFRELALQGMIPGVLKASW